MYNKFCEICSIGLWINNGTYNIFYVAVTQLEMSLVAFLPQDCWRVYSPVEEVLICSGWEYTIGGNTHKQRESEKNVGGE